MFSCYVIIYFGSDCCVVRNRIWLNWLNRRVMNYWVIVPTSSRLFVVRNVTIFSFFARLYCVFWRVTNFKIIHFIFTQIISFFQVFNVVFLHLLCWLLLFSFMKTLFFFWLILLQFSIHSLPTLVVAWLIPLFLGRLDEVIEIIFHVWLICSNVIWILEFKFIDFTTGGTDLGCLDFIWLCVVRCTGDLMFFT